MNTPDVVSAGRTIALLESLLAQVGAQSFGRVMQKLLAHTFRQRGYWVMSNAVGVPDFVAVRPGSTDGYAVEVKTAQGRALQLKERELKAVQMAEHTPIIAVLLFPDIDPRWLLLDARKLRVGSFDPIRLARVPSVSVGFAIDDEFKCTLAEFHDAAMTSSYALDRALQRATAPAT